jgi:opacity protein-like surface antigen
MKKLTIIWVLLILTAGSAAGQGAAIGIHGLYFQPAEQAFKDIYGPGTAFGAGGFIGLGKHLDLWVSGDYFQKQGELTFSKKETTVRIIPIAAGLRLRIPVSRINLYISGGAGYFLFKEENLIGTVTDSKIGYLGKAGCYIKIIRGLYMDGHFQYSHCSIQPLEVKADIGGLSFGIGIGYDFGLGEKEEKWEWREVK